MTYEPSVNRTLNPLAFGLVSALAMLLSACGTPAAKDFGGRWKPVNKYDDKVVEIPLALPYTYYAAPMDGTLKTMLTRWTKDTGLKLAYRLRSDFSLTRSASGIHTTELRDAAAQLLAVQVSPALPRTFNLTQPARFCPKSATVSPAGVRNILTGAKTSCVFTGSLIVGTRLLKP